MPDQLMKPWQVVIGNIRVQVMLEMVLHVHLEEAEHRPEVDGPRIQPVVETVAGQPDMLRQGEELLDRPADHRRDRSEKQHWKPASQIQHQSCRRRHDDKP